MHGIGLDDDAMNVYESEDEQIMTVRIVVCFAIFSIYNMFL
jgi:hypothetical protein